MKRSETQRALVNGGSNYDSLNYDSGIQKGPVPVCRSPSAGPVIDGY